MAISTVDFSEYNFKHCDYCSNYKSLDCACCTAERDWISVPTYFKTDNELALKLAKLLELSTKTLHNLEFDIEF